MCLYLITYQLGDPDLTSLVEFIFSRLYTLIFIWKNVFYQLIFEVGSNEPVLGLSFTISLIQN